MTKKDAHSLGHSLRARILSEGYCCVYGYLELCRARNETPTGMGENIGLPAHTIRHNYRCLKKGNRACANKPDCLKPTIEEILLNPPAPREK